MQIGRVRGDACTCVCACVRVWVRVRGGVRGGVGARVPRARAVCVPV